jgi:RHS repeat-associated protein
MCEERSAGGATIQKRFFPLGFQTISGGVTNVYFYFKDHLGSIRELSSTNSEIHRRYGYDPWGRRVPVIGDIDSEFGFTAHLTFPQYQWILAPYRSYDSESSRWLSRDMMGKQAVLAPYAYVNNDPISFVDRDGRFGAAVIGAVGGAVWGAATAIIHGDGSLGAITKGAISGAIGGLWGGAAVDLVTGDPSGGIIAAGLGALLGGALGETAQGLLDLEFPDDQPPGNCR